MSSHPTTNAPSGDVTDTEDGVITLVNAQAGAVFGCPRAEMPDRSVVLLVPDALRDVHPDHRARYFARPVSRPVAEKMELTARRRDGIEFPAEISLSAIRPGSGLRVFAAIRDVLGEA